MEVELELTVIDTETQMTALNGENPFRKIEKIK